MTTQLSLHSPSRPLSSPSPAEKILRRIFELRNVLPTASPFSLDAHHLEKIRAAERAGAPLRLVLPAFPAKSPNREKTLGILPDMGEVLALHTLNALARDIARLHAPGAEVVLCSDGRVFSDLVGVPDADVDVYSAGIRRILAGHRLTFLSTYNLEDHFPGPDYNAMRAHLLAEYSVPLTPDDRALFNGIHRFLFEDQWAAAQGKSRNRVREEAKTTAYAVVQRSQAWSRLVERNFLGALRLSIHPQPLDSKKIGVQLVAGGDRWSTPWHGVALWEKNAFRLVKRREAEAWGARLVPGSDHFHAYYILGDTP